MPSTQAWELGAASPAATRHLSEAWPPLQGLEELQTIRPLLSTSSSFLGPLKRNETFFFFFRTGFQEFEVRHG